MRRTVIALLGALAGVVPGVAVALSAGGGSGAGMAPELTSVFHRPLDGIGSVRNDDVTSSNWSGYAVEATTQFTSASVSWTQPTATCSGTTPAYAAFWVGIDGYSSGSVEQLGTDSDCSGGRPTYYAWWEMYPANSVSLSTTGDQVRPGDTLSASVSRNGTAYALTLHSSEGWTFSTTQTGTHANSSAEWVAESPEICTLIFCHLAKLADFGSITFTSAQAATGGAMLPIAALTTDGGPHDVTMTGNGSVRAQPGALGGAGSSFTDTWRHS